MFDNPDYFDRFSELSDKMSEIPLRLMISRFFAEYEQNSIIIIFF